MIGGNKEAILQEKTVSKNEIGGNIITWENKYNLKGFLDFLSGGSEYANYNAKIQESTHVFICDYTSIDIEENQCRLIVDNKEYEITLIDNPMELNKHLEFYLKYVGD